VRPLFVEWQKFVSSSLGLLMLQYLDENEKRWQSTADKEITHCKSEQASISCARNVTCASIEVKKECDTEICLPFTGRSCSTVSIADESDSGAMCAQRRSCTTVCSADYDEPQNCCNNVPKPVESRRGSLSPQCDTIALVSPTRRRNSAPVISHCAALTVKKQLLATLAEHTSSLCLRINSAKSECFCPCYSHLLCPKAVGSKISAWTAGASFDRGNTCVSTEGRPCDRRSNSHALVFRQCLFAGRLPGRRYSSPVVGQEHWMNSDSESVPLLSSLIPSNTVCSQSALVTWFVATL